MLCSRATTVRIRLYVDNPRLGPAIAVFGVPRLRLRGGTEAVAFDYDLTGA
jgi:hypothetical protein